MPVLLALSILAFVALAWATISIAGFVRRARRRRRRHTGGTGIGSFGDSSLRGSPASAGVSPPVFYVDPEAATAAREEITREAVQNASATSDPLPIYPSASEPAVSEDVLSSSARTRSAAPILPPPPPPELNAAPPPRLRSFPTRLGKHAASANSSGKWNPFSNDFADLTDPEPSRRSAARTGKEKR